MAWRTELMPTQTSSASFTAPLFSFYLPALVVDNSGTETPKLPDRQELLPGLSKPSLTQAVGENTWQLQTVLDRQNGVASLASQEDRPCHPFLFPGYSPGQTYPNTDYLKKLPSKRRSNSMPSGRDREELFPWQLWLPHAWD